MGTPAWISNEQRECLVKSLVESLQTLVFAKGGQQACKGVNWEGSAVSIEARAYRVTLFHSESHPEPLQSPAAVQKLFINEVSQLLIEEVRRITRAVSQPVPQRTFSLNPVPEGLKKVQTNHYASKRINQGTVWGWLVPGSRALQHVALKGAGVAIGRGKEAMWACLANQQSPRMASSPQRAGMRERMQDVARRNLRSVEVADGRVSRLHCLITLTITDAGPVAVLEDCSSNGTFLNGVKLGKGSRTELKAGDRISLVLSVAPLAEQYFTYHAHNPTELDPDLDFCWPESAPTSAAANSTTSSPRASPHEGQRGGPPPVSTSLWRTTTSRYTTAEQSTLEDLSCQICLGPLVACLALEPCGHNFCASCLSHHFATQSQGGLQLSCPFRCPAPERVVINHAVRALVELLQQQQLQLQHSRPSSQPATQPFTDLRHARHAASFTSATAPSSLHLPASDTPSGSSPHGLVPSRSSEITEDPPQPSYPHSHSDSYTGSSEDEQEGGEGAVRMSGLFPLPDEALPMDAAALKAKQVEVALQQLKAPAEDSTGHNVSLEALARLAWSDDTVREVVASSGGIPAIVEVMKQHQEHDGVQCNACLALMALVRGEGDVCQANQWHIAKAGAVEAVVQAMQTYAHSSSVQLSALLCFIPLVLDNTMMQAHVTVAALPRVLAALTSFPEEPDIQTKGLVLLGVLMQGDDVVHDAVRQKELEAGLPACVGAALQHFSDNDDVLWAALFCLAVLVRDSSKVFGQVSVAVARSGIHQLLQDMVAAYVGRQQAAGVEADEMIVCTGEYLGQVLCPLVRRLHRQKAYLAAGAVALIGVAVAMWRVWGRSAEQVL